LEVSHRIQTAIGHTVTCLCRHRVEAAVWL